MLAVAMFGGIVKRRALAISLRCLKVQRLIEFVRQTNKSSFPVYIRSDFQVHLSHAHESVSNVNPDGRGVHRFSVRLADRHIGAARSCPGINQWHVMRGLRFGNARYCTCEYARKYPGCKDHDRSEITSHSFTSNAPIVLRTIPSIC